MKAPEVKQKEAKISFEVFNIKNALRSSQCLTREDQNGHLKTM